VGVLGIRFVLQDLVALFCSGSGGVFVAATGRQCGGAWMKCFASTNLKGVSGYLCYAANLAHVAQVL
jgi:hypothetical protein